MRPGMPAVRRPVDLAQAALGEATTKLRRVLAITSRCVAGIDAHDIERLFVTATEAIHSGKAARGLRLTPLLEEAGVGTGHARERHFTPALSELADLTIRMTTVDAFSRAVRYEHLYVSWARTGRQRNTLATDRVPHVTPGIRFSGIAISCDDRHLPTLEVPFVTGTRHDRSSPRANRREITRLTSELGRRPHSSPPEHFAELFELQRRARSRLRAARTDGALTPLADMGFSDLVVAGPMPCGPAPRRSLHGAETYWPGGDRELIDVLLGAGKRGVAHMGRALLEPCGKRARGQLARAGFSAMEPTYSPQDRKLANGAEWRVAWYWSETSECLARVHAQDAIAIVDKWRVVGLSGELDVAVALIRRHAQQWVHQFIEQNMLDTAPGLIKASSYRSDAALRDLLRVGFAGLVDAERKVRTRAAAS
jgi:hypothetical protein